MKETCLIQYFEIVHQFMKQKQRNKDLLQGKKDNPQSSFHETKAKKQGKNDKPQNKKAKKKNTRKKKERKEEKREREREPS